MSGWSSVPVADTAIDRHDRAWFLVHPSLWPFESLWHCPETDDVVSWGDLNAEVGVEDCWNGGRYAADGVTRDAS